MKAYVAEQGALGRDMYCVIPGALDKEVADFLFEYVQEQVQQGQLKPDTQVQAAPAAYGDPLMEEVLLRLTPLIEHVAACRVYPTYSYYRLYLPNNVLKIHCDREACEVSLSINLGQLPAVPWPLWIRGPQGPAAVLLQPGDALLYRGIECEHWREAYTGDCLAQLFLHYVTANGPNAEWRFDKRQNLNLCTATGV